MPSTADTTVAHAPPPRGRLFLKAAEFFFGRALAWPSLAVVRRELLTTMRSKQPVIWLVLIVCATAFGVYTAWPDEGVRISGTFPGAGISAQTQPLPVASSRSLGPRIASAQVSRRVFRSFLFALAFGSILFIPALSGGAISSEREKETLEQLSVTLVSPSGVLLAKLSNTLGMYMLLFVGTIPVVATIFLSVGLDWREVFSAYAILLGMAVLCASIGLLCSSFFRKSTSSLVASYIGVMAVLWGVGKVLFFPFLLLAALVGGSPRAFYVPYLAVRYSPLSALVNMSTRPGVYTGVIAQIVWTLIQSLICLCLARFFLRRRAYIPVKESAEKPIDDPLMLAARKRTFPYYLVDPLKRKKPIPDHRNPMAVRELWWGTFRNTTVMVRLFYITLLILFLASSRAVFISPRISEIIPCLVMTTVLTLLIAPALVASAFTKEREQGNTDLLRLTLLSPSATVRGKILGGFLCLSPVLIAGILANFVLLIHGAKAIPILFSGYVTLAVCVLFAVNLSVYVSLLAKGSVPATVVTYFILGFTFLGLPMVLNQFFHRYITTRTWRVFSPLYVFAENGPGSGALLISLVLFMCASWGLYKMALRQYGRTGGEGSLHPSVEE